MNDHIDRLREYAQKRNSQCNSEIGQKKFTFINNELEKLKIDQQIKLMDRKISSTSIKQINPVRRYLEARRASEKLKKRA